MMNTADIQTIITEAIKLYKDAKITLKDFQALFVEKKWDLMAVVKVCYDLRDVFGELAVFLSLFLAEQWGFQELRNNLLHSHLHEHLINHKI